MVDFVWCSPPFSPVHVPSPQLRNLCSFVKPNAVRLESNLVTLEKEVILHNSQAKLVYARGEEGGSLRSRHPALPSRRVFKPPLSQK